MSKRTIFFFGYGDSYYEVAAIISKETKQKIVYTNPSILKFRRRMVQKGLKSDYIMVMIGIYTAAKLGLAKRITPDLVNLLGRSPITMKKFVCDYKNQIIFNKALFFIMFYSM